MKLNFLVSLTTDDNDYQFEQAAAAEQAAKRLEVGLEIIYAQNDVVTQSQQLLKAIQAPQASRPHAIVFEPVSGTALPQVARQAVAAKIGWVVVNSDVDYLGELRASGRAPVFEVSSDHFEVGRIQGRQIAALLPQGGNILYIQGPSNSAAAQQRTAGMQEIKPANVRVTLLKAQWTEASAHHAVSSWLRLSTAQKSDIHLIAAQDDSMAMGARRAIEEHTLGKERERWLAIPFLGCDGLPKTGQAWVRNGMLAGTVIIPPNTGLALEKLVQAISKNEQLPERVLTVPAAHPAIEKLVPRRTPSGSFIAGSRG
jgi:ribose transport system substrate-binding protein